MRSESDGFALANSWPLFEEARRFELGHVLSSVVTDLIDPVEVGGLGLHHAGCWECNLADNKLTWSGGVFDLFGLQRGANVTRDHALSLYSEDSRAAMERLRRYAIRARRGFTLDVTIRPAIGGTRTMRLITAPICTDGRVVRLHGLKLLV
jgi:hypothetical protein